MLNLFVVCDASTALSSRLKSFVPITFKEPALALPGASPTPPAGPDIRVEVLGIVRAMDIMRTNTDESPGNAVAVHRWIREARQYQSSPNAAFVAIEVTAALHWPLAVRHELPQWLNNNRGQNQLKITPNGLK